MTDTVRIIIADTCVVSDFYKADRGFFAELRCPRISIGIITPVIDELTVSFPEFADRPYLGRIGLNLFEPAEEDFAHIGFSSELSPFDQLCLRAAKRLGCTLATNDVPLREACAENGVRVLWGLETLLLLCREGAIGKKYADTVARGIRHANPDYITEEILDKFLRRLGRLP